MFHMSNGSSKAMRKAYIMSRSSRGSARSLEGPGGGVDAGCTGSWCEKMLFTHRVRRAIAISCVPDSVAVREDNVGER